ncbi:hypothetical protein BGZ47_005024, partial [Haplosporangium gracile]
QHGTHQHRSMSSYPPVPIPRSSVLPPPGSANHILQKNPHWRLGAWRVNGGVWSARVSPSRPSYSSTATAQPPGRTNSIKQPSGSLSS